jgi:hypothetical protein
MKTFLLIFGLALTSAGFGQGNDNETVHGKVRELRIDIYDVSADSNGITMGRHQDGDYSNVLIKYNKKSKRIEQYYGYDEGKFRYLYLGYYAKNTLLDSVISFTDTISNPRSWNLYTYDKKKKKKKKKKRLISSKEMYHERNYPAIMEYIYDDRGKLSKKNAFNWNAADWTWEYTYDSQGDMIGEREIYSGQDTTLTNYEYDKNHNIIMEISRDSNGEVLIYNRFKYDTEGRVIEVCNNRDWDTCRIMNECEYDIHGNITDEKRLEVDVLEYFDHHKMTYEYDKHKNWIRKTIYHNDEPKEIVIRTITY